MKSLAPEYNPMSNAIIASAIEVHREPGPGLLEGICERCMAEELRRAGLRVARQVSAPIK